VLTVFLTKNNIEKHKFRLCLEHHIGNCKGPCEGLQTREDYEESITAIKSILKGNINAVIDHLEQQMLKHATKYEFEQAQSYKEKIDALEKYKGRSVVVSPTIHHVDVFSFIDDQQGAFINYLRVISGAIIQSHTIELKRKLDETPSDLLLLAIAVGIVE
jgi:excinuclease ABC subunit C